MTKLNSEMDFINSQCRIVLIDDDPICHLISEKMIKRYSSHHIEAFTSANQALQQLQWRADHAPAELPDVILLDLDMPQMNGWEFLEEFQKLPSHSKIDVVILTSSVHRSDKARAMSYSVVRDFISKPITEDVVKMIRKSA